MSATRLPPDAPAVSPTLLGRDRQLGAVARAVAGVRAGSARFVLIEGESGFGKSALLRTAAASVALWPTRSAIADENEAELPYGVLNQLLRQVDEQESLEPVLSGGIAPDVPAMVAGAALLNLIDASEGATCITIDDAQWLDQRSADALWFAGRRSFRDRLLVLVAARPAETPFLERMRLLVADEERGVRLHVSGLSVDHVATLLKRRTGSSAPRRLASGLVAATDGNALHLQTLLNQAVSGTDPLGSLDRMLQGTPPAAPGFRAVTQGTLDRLPPPARAILEIIAVLHDTAAVPDVAAIAQQVGGHELTGGDIDEACATGLVVLTTDDSAIRMPHERVRAVIVGSLPLQTKQRIHAAAGKVVSGHRALGHRAHAAAGPDDALAAELDTAAGVAAAEHQVDRAFRYARWAASLSASAADKERRTIDAGVHATAARRYDLLATALPEFENLATGPEREVLLGNAALATGDVAAAFQHLELAAGSIRTGTPRAQMMRAVAHQTLAEIAVLKDQFALSLRHSAAVLDVVPGLRRSAQQHGIAGFDVDELEANAVSSRAAAAWQSGQSDPGHGRLDELIAEAHADVLLPKHAILLLTRGSLHRQQRRLGHALTDLEAGIALADLGRPELSAHGRIELALTHFRNDEWDAAAATATAAVSISDDIDNPGVRASAYAVAAFVPAARGDREAADAWLAEADATPASMRTNGYRRLADFARALSARASGNSETAAFLARRAIAREPVHAQIERDWWQQLLTEALGPANPPMEDPLAVLSGREREVAHLAAQGLTNREVAGRLFVSVKGVEYHMGNVLAKLGLSSRRGIRGVIERN
jgi:ATP/maltotriose-dependent transcriptional regulator MalT